MIPAITGCPVPGDGIHCPLCRYAQTAVVQRLTETFESLTGKVSDAALYSTLEHLYVEERKLSGESIGELTTQMLMEHFEEHTVAVHKQLAGDIQFCAAVQKHLRSECVACADGSGVHLSAPAVMDWMKVSAHKLKLLSVYNTMVRPLKTAPSAQPYDLS